jgi:SpoVK/Ycf46/Vps4 family AAA+-type ATPase
MQNFHIIQALCRSALSSPSKAVIRQVERLRDALEKEGDKVNAKKLARLLSSVDKTCDMAPSRIQRSKTLFAGEQITTKTPIPVDKETSTPLAEIAFPENLPENPPILNENVELAIQSVLNEWVHFDKLYKIDVQPARSVLIHGLPGTGKTHLALWLAKHMRLPVVVARLDGLMSSYLGTTSRNIGNLFSFASKYRCILLLDEFDAIAKLRNDPQEVGEVKRVVNTLLQNLDSRKNLGFTIGITNHESLLDPAIWRRFDIQIEIPAPSPEVLYNLITKFIHPLKLQDEEVKFLSWCIEGGSGADVKSLIQWLKKSRTLEGSNSLNLVSLLKRFSLLNSGRIDVRKRNLLAHGDDELIFTLLNESSYGFKQKEVASLLGVTPSTLSKKIAKHKEHESEAAYA